MKREKNAILIDDDAKKTAVLPGWPPASLVPLQPLRPRQPPLVDTAGQLSMAGLRGDGRKPDGDLSTGRADPEMSGMSGVRQCFVFRTG